VWNLLTTLALSAAVSIETLHPVATVKIGKTADWVVATPDAVWVGSTKPNAVHRIDPRTNTEAATVHVPGAPCAGLVTGFGSLWVPLCAKQPALARVDLAANRVQAVFKVGTAAECGIAASSDSLWLVTDDAGSLARIDPTTGTIRQTVRLPAGSCNPRFSAGIVWVTNAKGAQLTAVAADTGAILATVATGPNPRFLTDGANSIWTLNQGDGSLTRVDIATRQVTASIPLNTPGPGGDIAFGADVIWTTMAKIPLTATAVQTNTVLRQWRGPGGDSLVVAHGAIWLTDYHKGTITRLRLEDALAR
jgi:virginiamycin B lyase